MIVNLVRKRDQVNEQGEVILDVPSERNGKRMLTAMSPVRDTGMRNSSRQAKTVFEALTRRQFIIARRLKAQARDGSANYLGNLVSCCGGRIWVERRAGLVKGSVFTLRPTSACGRRGGAEALPGEREDTEVSAESGGWMDKRRRTGLS